MDSADLNVVFVRNRLKRRFVLGEERKLDVNRTSQSSAKVSGAGGDVTQVVIVSEFGDGLNVSDGAAKSVENLTDVCAGLHRDDTQLVLFVNPHKESLVVVVEDTSAVGPVTVQVAGLEETISLPNDLLEPHKLT